MSGSTASPSRLAAIPAAARVLVAGLPVDPVSTDEAVGRARSAIQARQRLRISVANANKAWLGYRDARLHGLVSRSGLVIAEWAIRWGAGFGRGVPDVPHVGGLTLMTRLLDEAEAEGWSVYLLGGRPDTVEALAARLGRERPRLRLAGYHHGYLDRAAEAKVGAELEALAPDLLFIAMGSPRQEGWAERLDRVRPDGAPFVTLGVGGSFDVLSGRKRDAPAWMRGRGLEWIYRLGQDPRRLAGRYLRTNPWLVIRCLRDRARPEAGRQGASRWIAPAVELDRWMARRDYRGHDPHDLLASSLVRTLSLGNRWLGVAWTQLGKRLPAGLHRALGVPPLPNAKGTALVLASHIRLASAGAEGDAVERARQLVDRLSAEATPTDAGIGWGYPFPWANRASQVPAGTPSSVVTSFVADALLDAEARLSDRSAGRLAEEAGRFLANGLPRVDGAFTYTPRDRRVVHNANLLAASLLARLAARGGPLADEHAATAERAARFSVDRQEADGSWRYGTSPADRWVDSFHQGYILVALHGIRRDLGRPGVDRAIEAGLAYWLDRCFQGPAVGLYPGRPFPVETHAVAQAILTLLTFRDEVEDAVGRARELGDWALAHLRHPDGSFLYRVHRWGRTRGPYMRWTQAWMLRALAELADVEAMEVKE